LAIINYCVKINIYTNKRAKMKDYFKDFGDKCKESARSILPFFAIIFILYLMFMQFNIWACLSIVIATVIMIIGMALFSVGVDMSTMKMGGYVGSHLSKSRKISFMLVLSFILGFIVTIAEPDLMVLAEQFTGVSSKWIILITVSAGTGIFLVLSTLRTLFRWNIKTILIISYAILFVLQLICNRGFVPLAYDCMGVTTGPISVPFIMSFGLGICAVRSGKNNQEDGFGLSALASTGPTIAVMLLSLFVGGNNGASNDAIINTVQTASEMGNRFGMGMISYLKEVFIVIIPIFLFFIIYNLIYLKLPKISILRIFIGLIYTYMGLVVFLCGVNAGYLSTANNLGFAMASSEYWWSIIPISLIIGCCLIFAEPAVHVLIKQVEDITEGVIRKKTILVSISIGVAIAVCMAVIRSLFAIDILWFIIPLIIIIIILSIFSPNLFASVAFDAGGIAAGSLSCSFVLPFIIGVCNNLAIDSMLYAFGTIGIISLMPIVVIEIMGIRYSIAKAKERRKERKSRVSTVVIYDFK